MQTPKANRNPFRPVKIILAVSIAAIFFFFPVSTPAEPPKENARLQPFIPFASAQEGCGACQQFGCIVWIWNGEDAENGDTTTCVQSGCVAIPACTPNPPTATLAISCATPGNNGWCRDSAEAVITVTNSQGQNFIISGNVNGNNFACPGGQSVCSAPLPEGIGTVSYVINTDAGFSVTDSAAYQLDVTTPQINGNINGSIGTNNWYITQAFVTASASDSLSGIASFEVSVDGGTWMAVESNQSTVISDGAHTVQYRATDNAGNSTETPVQPIKVDTITPTLNVSATGTNGLNGWYISNVTLTPTADDSVSGLAALEVSIDGLPFTNYQSPITFSDGIHSVRFQAADNAGNVTQTAPQTLQVDTVAPTLTAPASLNVLEILHYELSDPTSGLNQFSIAIFDKDSIQPATSNAWALTGNNSTGEFRWYATFGNDAVAGVGLHPITLRLTDMAGNETAQTGYIKVTWKNLRYMELAGNHNQANQAPSNSSGSIVYAGGSSPATGNESPSVQPAPEPDYGGETNTTPNEQQSTTVTAGESQPFQGASVQTGTSFTSGNQSTNSQSPISNVLWGAAAALLGSTLAEWQRRHDCLSKKKLYDIPRVSDMIAPTMERDGHMTQSVRAQNLRDFTVQIRDDGGEFGEGK